MISDLLGCKEILSSDITRANIMRQSIWLVYALVEATPISGPALMCTPEWLSLQMVDPTVLVMPMIRAPLDLQYLRAPKVSAVSPDCEIKKQTSSLAFRSGSPCRWWTP